MFPKGSTALAITCAFIILLNALVICQFLLTKPIVHTKIPVISKGDCAKDPERSYCRPFQKPVWTKERGPVNGAKYNERHPMFRILANLRPPNAEKRPPGC